MTTDAERRACDICARGCNNGCPVQKDELLYPHCRVKLIEICKEERQMTRREWVEKNMPDYTGWTMNMGGVYACPCDRAYEKMPDASRKEERDCPGPARDDLCTKCWDKEMVPITPEEEKPEEKKDMINPDHYKVHANECIEEIKAMLTPEEFRGFLKGNFLKYRYRTGHKDDPQQEAEKSDWYMNRLIATSNEEVSE